MAAFAAALLLFGVVLLAGSDVNHASASITPTALKGQTTELPTTTELKRAHRKPEKCIPDGQGLGYQWPTRPGPPLCDFAALPGGGFAQTGKANPQAVGTANPTCCSGNCYTSGFSSGQPYYPFYNCGTCNKPYGCAEN